RPDPLGFRRPGRRIFDADKDLEGLVDRMAEAAEDLRRGGVQLAPALAVMAVVNLVDHGDHPFSLLARFKARAEMRRCGRWRLPARRARAGIRGSRCATSARWIAALQSWRPVRQGRFR